MKKKMSWEFYSKRRKLTLEKFLEGCSSSDEILNRFSKENVAFPTCNDVNVNSKYYDIFCVTDPDLVKSAACVQEFIVINKKEVNEIDNAKETEDLEYFKKNLLDTLKMPEIFVSVVNSDEKQQENFNKNDYDVVTHNNEERTLQTNHKNFKKSKK